MAHPTERTQLSDRQLARLRAIGEPQRFTAGEVLVRPGEPGYPFFGVRD